MDRIEPFRIEIADSVLADLHDRLANTRWPTSLAGQGWTRSVDLDVLRDICTYWANEFDWRAVERLLNQFDQCLVDIGTLSTHCLHVRSPEAGAMPLILTHGWPSTFAEFLKVVGPLSDPVGHGGDARDAFHVVCPSIPGYGFSAAPRLPGFDVRAVARHLVQLMDALGYPTFAAQGGDWGGMATNWMALDNPDHLIAIHLNLVMAYPPEADALQGASPLERKRAERFLRLRDGGGHTYGAVQAITPHAVSPGLSDSPAGLAAWITEKFFSWTDNPGSPFEAVSIEDLLTNLTLYWVTNTIGSSIELYFESALAGTMAPPPRRIEVPTGGLLLPMDLLAPPRKWAEELYNIVHWTELESGGHFAALERPDDFVSDVRTFFKLFR